MYMYIHIYNNVVSCYFFGKRSYMYGLNGAHAHAHAHASFISTTTKPPPDSATNTDYVTLTLTASTTTPICNLLQPGNDVRLPWRGSCRFFAWL